MGGAITRIIGVIDLIDDFAAAIPMQLIGDLLGVLRTVTGFGAAVTTVLGNHDLHLITQHGGFERKRKDDTFVDVLEAPDANGVSKTRFSASTSTRSSPKAAGKSKLSDPDPPQMPNCRSCGRPSRPTRRRMSPPC